MNQSGFLDFCKKHLPEVEMKVKERRKKRKKKEGGLKTNVDYRSQVSQDFFFMALAAGCLYS